MKYVCYCSNFNFSQKNIKLLSKIFEFKNMHQQNAERQKNVRLCREKQSKKKINLAPGKKRDERNNMKKVYDAY